jgi:hypothetical protein
MTRQEKTSRRLLVKVIEHGLDDYGTLIFQNSTLIEEDKSIKRKIVFNEE